MTTWLASQHPEEVRIAQSVAVVRQHGGTAGFLLFGMAIGFLLQAQGGFGWGAVLWHLAMGALMYMARASWRRLRDRPLPNKVSPQRISRLTRFGAIYGACSAAGLVSWSSINGPEIGAMAIAMSMVMISLAAAMFYFMPSAVVAASVPPFAASLILIETTFSQAAAQIGMTLVLAHGAAVLWFLQRNWDQFVQRITLEARTAGLLDQLRAQKEVAEQAVQRQSQSLAAASHDLRQPMQAISLYLSNLYELDLPDRARRAVHDARECASGMNNMLGSLLDLSHLEARQARPELAVFDVAAILVRLQREFEPLARARDVDMRVRPCNALVHSDAVMVERIAMNFVSNAVRHAPGGRVLIACRRHGNSLRLSVHDTGCGIPASEQQAIFNEFHRLDTAPPPDSSGGFGLGLAIVRRLAQALQAPVSVRSAPARGSVFAVDLPLAPEQLLKHQGV